MNRTLAAGLLAVVILCTAQAATAASITRGPYLQMHTASSIVVRWRTDGPTTSQVRYGPSPDDLSKNVDDATATTEHIIALGGLSADTQYYYSVGAIDGPLGSGSGYYFRTAPPTGTAKPMRVWSLGDAGLVNTNLQAVRDAYAAFVGSQAADIFLLLGDNAYQVGNDEQYQAALFDQHAAILRTTPVWSVFGNHDGLSSNSANQVGPYFDIFSFPTAGEAGGIGSGTEAYYSFDYGDVHFVMLDSEQAPTSATSPMLTWLEADLQDAVMKSPDWIIGAFHRPPYSRGALHDSDNELFEVRMRQFVLPILENYGVDLVFSGHSHDYERSRFLDGHYGRSGTFSSDNVVQPGTGDPSTDGAYRKTVLGPDPHSGTVYVVNGSGSDLRTAILNHPAMVVNRLEIGSMVIDIDHDTLTARFVNGAAQLRDTFQIVKGSGVTKPRRSPRSTLRRLSRRASATATATAW
jgi:hypothetical protein